MPDKPPNHDEIIAYAKSRGLRNVSLVYKGLFGWSLRGSGRDENDWPLVWAICKECGIEWGCGATDHHQCKPERFKPPKGRTPC